MCRILIVLDDKLTILSLSLSLSPNDHSFPNLLQTSPNLPMPSVPLLSPRQFPHPYTDVIEAESIY